MTPISPTPSPPAPLPRPIVVLGFGRSGTTWISDIISKTLGGLLLFEPLHPQVCDFAAAACYSDASDPALANRLEEHLGAVLNGRERHKWLLRNHLFTPLQEVSNAFVDAIWRECQVIGFKEIRANFLIDWLVRRYDARIVYIARHPCAVLASLRRRPNFWKELGWDAHRRLFSERVLPLSPAGEHWATFLDDGRTDLEQQTAMWAATHALATRQLQQLDLPVLYYEDFYEQPFAATRNLLRHLGHPTNAIHPAHLFVPSMTTLRTVHGLTATETTYAEHGESLFWEDVLDQAEVTTIMDIVAAFGVTDYRI